MLSGAFSLNSLYDQLYAADIEAANEKISSLTAVEAASDEDYWTVIQQAYTVNPNIINLNNGGVSPAPKVVQDALERYNRNPLAELISQSMFNSTDRFVI